MLTLGQLAQTNYQRMSHTLTLKEDQKMSSLDDPNFWANIALKLQPLDQIYVFSNDGMQYAELVVLQCSRLYAKVGVVNEANFDKIADNLEDESCDYKVQWKGPSRKWEVIRKSDGSTVSEAHTQREDATAAMNEYIKVIAA